MCLGSLKASLLAGRNPLMEAPVAHACHQAFAAAYSTPLQPMSSAAIAGTSPSLTLLLTQHICISNMQNVKIHLSTNAGDNEELQVNATKGTIFVHGCSPCHQLRQTMNASEASHRAAICRHQKRTSYCLA